MTSGCPHGSAVVRGLNAVDTGAVVPCLALATCKCTRICYVDTYVGSLCAFLCLCYVYRAWRLQHRGHGFREHAQSVHREHAARRLRHDGGAHQPDDEERRARPAGSVALPGARAWARAALPAADVKLLVAHAASA